MAGGTGTPVTREEVVRHFLRIEAGKPSYAASRSDLLKVCLQSDYEVFEYAKSFAASREDTNPTLVYTVGTKKCDRSANVASWTRLKINCKDIFTCGIGPSMREDLDAVRGNLSQFASQYANKYPEFRQLEDLSDSTRLVIVVEHRNEDKKGLYEAIDGAHRIVALCRASVEQIEAYVARVKSS